MIKHLQELIEQKAYAEFRKEVLELNDADVASVVTELEKAEQLKNIAEESMLKNSSPSLLMMRRIFLCMMIRRLIIIL